MASLNTGNLGIARLGFMNGLLINMKISINQQNQKKYLIMNSPPVASKNHLQQAFEHLALSLEEIFIEFDVPDEVFWESSKHMHKTYMQIEEKLLPQTSLQEEGNLHPATAELIRKISQS